MNERIQELSYQCWYNDPDTGKEEFDRTKFAELIVRECGEVALKHIYNDGSFSLIPIVLNKHFGIEE